MTDTSLTISWPEGQLTAQPGTEVTIGRDPGGSIVLASTAVSRRHARIWHETGEWRFSDQGSTQGSFSGGSAVQTVAITDSTDVVLGQGPEAVLLSLAPAKTLIVPLGAQATRTASGRVMAEPMAGTVSPDAMRPGGALATEAVKAATVIPASNDDRAVELSTHEAKIGLRPGETATLGRDDDNDLVVHDATVSRRHLRVEHDGTFWQLVDLGSAAGTWLHDSRVTRERLVGQQSFTLGDRHGTTTLRTSAPELSAAMPPGPVPGSEAATPGGSRNRLIAVLTAAVLLVAALGGAGWWLTHRGVDKNNLAKGTVRIQTDGWSGSGTIIDAKRGLILTNAHVAAPQAMGTGVRDGYFPEVQPISDESRSFVISIASGLDKSAEPRFRAKVVAADGYLDLAVIKITKTLAGATVGADDLEGLVEVPIGDSNAVHSSDKVTVIGYPGAAESIAPTLTEGVVSGVQGDPRMDINNALLNLDAVVAHGNSGGLAADSSGNLVGVPSLLLDDKTTKEYVLSAMRPVALAKPLIRAAQKGKTYVSPWTEDAPDSAKISAVSRVAPHDSMVSTGCDEAADTSSGAVFAYGFDYTGFPTGPNTDVIGVLYDAAGRYVNGAVSEFPSAMPAQGCATLTFATDDGAPLPDGAYTLDIGLGGNFTSIASANLTVGAASPDPTGTDTTGTDTAPPLG